MAESTSGWLRRHHEFMASHTDTLLDTIALAVNRAGLASFKGDTRWEAREILGEAHRRALMEPAASERQTNLMSWMLRLAFDVLGERQLARYRLLGMSDPALAQIRERMAQEAQADTKDFDWVVSIIMARSTFDAQELAAAHYEFDRQLERVSQSDRAILRLGILMNLDSDDMAEELRCSPAEAQLRFHDAFSRLRSVWIKPGRPFTE